MISALLFDLGGVVIDIDFDRVYRHWCRHSRLTLAQIRERCVFGDVYQRYERAEISDADFFAYVRDRLQIADASDEQLLEGWNAVFVRQNPEVLELLARVSPRVPCFAFTNTSASHQAAWSARFPAVPRAFRQVFSSAEMGRRKPEAAAFRQVAADIGVAPSSLLFFDDMTPNVEGARAVGLAAVKVTGPDDVRAALREHGFVD